MPPNTTSRLRPRCERQRAHRRALRVCGAAHPGHGLRLAAAQRPGEQPGGVCSCSVGWDMCLAAQCAHPGHGLRIHRCSSGPGGWSVVAASYCGPVRPAAPVLKQPHLPPASLHSPHQVQLLGATLSIGRPSGYVDPGKAAAAATVAAEALARFQVASCPSPACVCCCSAWVRLPSHGELRAGVLGGVSRCVHASVQHVGPSVRAVSCLLPATVH